MQIDDFMSRAAGEPGRTVTRTVWTTPTEVLAKAAASGSMRMTDLLSVAVPGRRAEQRDVRYRHIIGPPASPQAIDAWQSQHPLQVLPPDLRALVMRMNGIHLWANVETGRSCTGLAPIEDWDLARIKMYGPSADRNLLDDRYLALSYHQDGAAYVVLDVELGTYFLMDTAGPDKTSPIAHDAGELIEWLWCTRIAP